MFSEILILRTDSFYSKELAVWDAVLAASGVGRIIIKVIMGVCGFTIKVGNKLVIFYTYYCIQKRYFCARYFLCETKKGVSGI